MNRLRCRRFLRGVAVHSNLREYASDLLAPLLSYDSIHHGDLVRTLDTYFALAMNASKTAERLFLHRNGLAYRLGRVEELLRVSLDDPEVRLALQLALWLHLLDRAEPQLMRTELTP